MSARPIIERGRLRAVLDQRWEVRVTTVCAGAGFGKSTLVADAVRANRERPRGDDCWLGCEPADADGVRLARDLLTALTGDPSGGEHDPLGAIAGAIWARTPRQVALVLDDVHEVAPGSSGAQLLDDLVRELPANGHLVFVGRRPPPVALARFRAHGVVAELHEDDLAFTEEEIARFAELREIDRDRITAVGGWPALVELSAASPRADHVHGFLAEEVLASRGPQEVEILEALALVGPADSDLLGRVLGRPVAEAELADLLTVVPLAARDDAGWWRLHPLWRTAVERRVGRTERSRWLAAAGRELLDHDPDGAIKLLTEARDDEATLAALRAVLRTPWIALPAAAIDELWATAPPALLETPEARVLSASAWALEAPERASSALGAIADEAEQCGDSEVMMAAIERLAVIANRRQDLATLLDVFARIDRLDHDGARIETLRALRDALLADAAGDAEGVLAALDRLQLERLDGYWRAPIAWLRAQATLALGHAEAAVPLSERALEMSPTPGLRGELAMLHVNALALAGRPDDARHALTPMLADLDAHGSVDARAMGHALAAQRHALCGEVDEAQRRHAAAVELAGGSPAGPVRASIAGARALLAVAELDDELAARITTELTEEHPVDRGRQQYAHRRRLALSYVLVADTRRTWDGIELGPVFAAGRDLARAVVAIRELGDLRPAQRLTSAHWQAAPGCLPMPWLCELALAALAESTDAALALKRLDEQRVAPVLRHIVGRAAHRTLARRARSVLASMPIPPTHPLEIRALGALEVIVGGRPVDHPAWRRERVRTLLGFLTCRRSTTRQDIALALWPEMDAEAASRNLRVTLSYLLAVIEPDRPRGQPSYFVRTDGNRLSLTGGDLLRIDIDEFLAAHDHAIEEAGRDAPAAELAHHLGAVSIARGPLLADLGPEEWLTGLRDRLLATFVESAVRAGELSLAAGEADHARHLAERAIAAEPWSEAARRLLVASHLERQDRAAARRALEACMAMLDELGVGPETETEMIARRLG